MSTRAGLVLRSVFVAASLIFLAVALVRSWDEVAAAFGDGPLWLVLLMVTLAAATMSWTAVVWVLVLRALGGDLGIWRGSGIFFVGEAAKYLPGALWSVVGRGELAAQHGVERGTAYASALVSMGLNYVIAAAGACVVLLPIVLATSPGVGGAALWFLVVLPVGVLLLHPRAVGVAQRVAERLLRRELGIRRLPWGSMIRLAALYLPVWGLAGLTSVAAVGLVDADASPVRVVFAACLAWLVGFLVVPVPSGLGVREGVFAAAMSAELTSSQALAAALLARFAFIAADSIGALLGMAALRSRRHEVVAR